jgi:hypothetical protein
MLHRRVAVGVLEKINLSQRKRRTFRSSTSSCGHSDTSGKLISVAVDKAVIQKAFRAHTVAEDTLGMKQLLV